MFLEEYKEIYKTNKIKIKEFEKILKENDAKMNELMKQKESLKKDKKEIDKQLKETELIISMYQTLYRDGNSVGRNYTSSEHPLSEYEALYEEKLKNQKVFKKMLNSLLNKLKVLNENIDNIPLIHKESKEAVNQLQLFNKLYAAAFAEVDSLRKELKGSLKNKTKELAVELGAPISAEADISELKDIFVMRRYTTGNKTTIDADLVIDGDAYVVLAGSLIAREADAGSNQSVRQMYGDAIDEDYILNRNLIFSNIKAATSFVLGFSSEGDLAWVHEETGKTIVDYNEELQRDFVEVPEVEVNEFLEK